jgi:hypothetical protein
MARKARQGDPDEDPLLTEVKRLTSHHFLRTQNTWARMVWYNVVRGMAFGFGSLVGATVIVYIVIAILSQVVSQIDFIPLLSEWIAKILEVVEESRATGG